MLISTSSSFIYPGILQPHVWVDKHFGTFKKQKKKIWKIQHQKKKLIQKERNFNDWNVIQFAFEKYLPVKFLIILSICEMQ